MNKTAQVGNWSFELKQVFCRKALVHGDDFQASAVITITDGVPHIELLINKENDTFTEQDHDDFKVFVTSLGFENAKFSRYKNGIKKEVEKTV